MNFEPSSPPNPQNKPRPKLGPEIGPKLGSESGMESDTDSGADLISGDREQGGLNSRLQQLKQHLKDMGRILVAYSGGVDSSFLLKVAHDVSGDRVLGVLAHSESLDVHEQEHALQLAAQFQWPVKVIQTQEYQNEAYRKNDQHRCYHCKSELFTQLVEFAQRENFDVVLDGSNEDDRGDYRPGAKARDENAVRSPLQELHFTKAEIRAISKHLGLPTWDKPQAPCLASRIPYGSEVTYEKLRQVEATEKALRDQGFKVVRVRHHQSEARIEVPPEDFHLLLDEQVRENILKVARSVGFQSITLDLEGFRSGKLNDALGKTSTSDPAVNENADTFLPLSQIDRFDLNSQEASKPAH